MLDNLESILRMRERAEGYCSSNEDYENLLKNIADEVH